MEPLVTVCQSKIKAIRLDEPLELDSHWEFVCSAKCIGALQHIHIRAMFSIGLNSTVAFPLVAFQGTLSHGSEVSALAIITLAMTLSQHMCMNLLLLLLLLLLLPPHTITYI